MIDPNNPGNQQYSPPLPPESAGPDAPTEAYFPQLPPQASPLPSRVRPEQLIRRNQNMPPGPLHQKLMYLWRTDPAYRVLYISLAFVIVAFLIFLLVVGGIFAHGNTPTKTQQVTSGGNTGQQSQPDTKQPNNAPKTPAAQPTAQPTPTPTPLPTPTPTPIPTQPPTPTPIPQPTPTPIPAQLTAQITNVPNFVQNNSTVQVTVQTNQPNASVTLVALYEGIPTATTSNPVQTDANGTATINWNIHERKINRGINTITARLVARATAQNGQQAQTQEVTVQIQANN
jgi:outer membrane biosynthesis protein TonB